MTRTRLLLLAGFAVLLLSAIGLVVYGGRQIAPPRFAGGLEALLPAASAGWVSVPRDIAETEEMRQAVGEILNYTEGVLRDYVRDGRRISVYIAYWSPGRMNYREVASHTPDVCWPAAGWHKTAAATLSPFTLGEAMIPGGEGRVFRNAAGTEHVWFWHVVGERVHSYGTGYKPAWHAMFTDIFRWGLNQREEQFFIRISSNEPLEQQLAEPVLQQMLAKLPFPVEPPAGIQSP